MSKTARQNSRPSKAKTVNTYIIFIFLFTLPLCYYFFIHVPYKEDIIKTRNLRLIKDFSQQISDKMNDLATLIHTGTQDVVESYTDKGNIETSIKGKLKLIPELQIINISYEKLPVNVIESYLNQDAHIYKDNSISWVDIEVRRDQNTFIALLKFSGIFGSDTQKNLISGSDYITIIAKIEIKDIVDPIVSRGMFEDILISTRDGEIIYQRNKKHFIVTRLDSTNVSDHRSIEYKNLQRSIMGNMRFAEKDFKVFSQPFALTLKESQLSKTKPSDKKYSNWIIHGLIARSNFVEESRAISYNIILAFSLLLLMLILIWPTIKLWHIGAHGRFRIVDLVLLSISIVFLLGVLTFTVLDYDFYTDLLGKLDEQLEEFSDKLETDLLDELDQYSTLLDSLNYLYDTNNSIKSLPAYADSVRGFIRAFWVDSTGMETAVWTKSENTNPLVNVSQRPYFNNIKKGKPWRRAAIIDSSLDSYSLYFLQPIYSKTTGQNLAVFSKPFIEDARKESIAVACAIILPPVLFESLLPHDFGFVIIDENGQALFHQDKRRNLRENFITNCDENKALIAAVYSKKGKCLNLEYGGRSIRACVRPLSNTDWTIITYRKKDTIRTANIEILITSIAIYFIFSLGIVAILFTIYYIGQYHISRYHLPPWALPNMDNSNSYFRMFLVYLSLFAGLSLYAFFGENSEMPGILFILGPVFINVVGYLAVSSANNPLSARINIIMRDYPVFTFVSVVLICTFVLFAADIAAFESFLAILFLIGGSILLFPATKSFILNSPISGTEQNTSDAGTLQAIPESPVKNRLSYRFWYVSVAVFVLAINSIFPAISLFRIIGNSELELFLKDVQYKLVRDLDTVNFGKEEFIHPPDIASYYHHTRIDFPEKISSDIIEMNTDKDLFWESLGKVYGKFRLSFNQTSSNTKNLNYNSANDSTWVSKTDNGKAQKLELYYRNKSNKLTRVVSELPKISGYIGLSAIMGLLVIIVGTFIIIFMVFKRISIFEFSLLKQFKSPVTIEEILDVIEVDEESKDITRISEIIKQHLLIITPPLSGVSRFLKKRKDLLVFDLVKEDKNEYAFEDFLKGNLFKPVVIDHFEYVLIRPGFSRSMVTFLEKLLDGCQNKILLVSTVDPTYHLDKLDLPGEDDSEGLYLRWSGILAKFEKVYREEKPDPAETDEVVRTFKEVIGYNKDVPESAERRFKQKLISTFLKECSVTKRLQNIGFEIIRSGEFTVFSEEALIHQITNRAYPYYNVLWSTCSKEEKLVLIQLSEDGVITIQKLGIVKRLIKRGLVTVTSYPAILNESFKRFVLSVYKSEDVEAEKTESRWHSIRIPLFLAILALIVFMSFTQQNYFSDSLTFLSALAALVPTLLRLSTLFFGGNKEKAA